MKTAVQFVKGVFVFVFLAGVAVVTLPRIFYYLGAHSVESENEEVQLAKKALQVELAKVKKALESSTKLAQEQDSIVEAHKSTINKLVKRIEVLLDSVHHQTSRIHSYKSDLDATRMLTKSQATQIKALHYHNGRQKTVIAELYEDVLEQEEKDEQLAEAKETISLLMVVIVLFVIVFLLMAILLFKRSGGSTHQGANLEKVHSRSEHQEVAA